MSTIDAGAERGDRLRLLGALAPADFLARSWGKRPCRLRPAAAFVPGFDRRAFTDLLAAGNVSTKVAFRDANGEHRERVVDARLAQASFAAGQTVCVDNLQRHVPAIARSADDVKLALGLAGPVVVNGYWSPHDAGFGVHFDAQDVFIVQLAGSKRWSHAQRPALSAPPRNLIADDLARGCPFAWTELRAPRVEEFSELILDPGDALYLPAGTWHTARATGESLALSITCVPLPFAELLSERLRNDFEAHATWRAGPPACAGTGTQRRALAEAYFARRLEELRRWTSALTPADLEALWVDHGSRVSARGGTRETLPLRRDERLLRVPHLGIRYHAAALGDEAPLYVYGRGTKFRTQRAVAPWLDELDRRAAFVAEDAITFCSSLALTWEQVSKLLECLLGIGVLARERELSEGDAHVFSE